MPKQEIQVGYSVTPLFTEELSKDNTIPVAVLNNQSIPDALLGEKQYGLVSRVRQYHRAASKLTTQAIGLVSSIGHGSNIDLFNANLNQVAGLGSYLTYDTYEELKADAVNYPNYYADDMNSVILSNTAPFNLAPVLVGGFDDTLDKWVLYQRDNIEPAELVYNRTRAIDSRFISFLGSPIHSYLNAPEVPWDDDRRYADNNFFIPVDHCPSVDGTSSSRTYCRVLSTRDIWELNLTYVGSVKEGSGAIEEADSSIWLVTYENKVRGGDLPSVMNYEVRYLNGDLAYSGSFNPSNECEYIRLDRTEDVTAKDSLELPTSTDRLFTVDRHWLREVGSVVDPEDGDVSIPLKEYFLRAGTEYNNYKFDKPYATGHLTSAMTVECIVSVDDLYVTKVHIFPVNFRESNSIRRACELRKLPNNEVNVFQGVLETTGVEFGPINPDEPSFRYQAVFTDLNNPTLIDFTWYEFTESWLIENNFLREVGEVIPVSSVPFIKGKGVTRGSLKKEVDRVLTPFGIKSEKIQDALYEKPEDFDEDEDTDPKEIIEEAWLSFDLDIASDRKEVPSYLFEFFNRMYLANPMSEFNFFEWKNNPDGREPYRENLDIRESSFSKRVSWHYITKEVIEGTFTNAREFTWESSDEWVVIRTVPTPQGSLNIRRSVAKTTFILRKPTNRNNTHYIEIRVHGLETSNNIYKNRWVTSGLRKAQEDIDPETGKFNRMYVPLLLDVLNTLPYREQRGVSYYAMNLSVFTVYIRDKRFWERGWFRKIVVAATVVIAVAIFISTVGAGTSVSAALISMAISYAIGYVVLKGLIWLTDKIGIENSFILAVIVVAAVVVGLMTGKINLTTAMEILKLSTRHLEAVTVVSQDQLDEIRADTVDLIKNYAEKKKELDEKWDSLNSSIDWTTYHSYRFENDFNESPEEFISRCLVGADSTRLSLEVVSNFVDIMLELPKVKHKEVAQDE